MLHLKVFLNVFVEKITNNCQWNQVANINTNTPHHIKSFYGLNPVEPASKSAADLIGSTNTIISLIYSNLTSNS